MDQEYIVCPVCEKEVPATQRFCGNCGEQLYKDEVKPKRNKAKFFEPSRTVRAIILLCMAGVLFVFSLLPLVRYGYEIDFEGCETAYYTVSAFDTGVYFFESFRNRTDENLKDTYVYGEFYDAGGALDAVEDDAQEVQRLFDRIIHYSSRLTLMHENNKPTPSIIAAFVMSALYVLTCLAFLICAIKNITSIILKKRLWTRQCFTLLSFIPFLALLSAFIMSGPYGVFKAAGQKAFSPALIFTLIISICGIAYFIAQKAVAEKKKNIFDKRRFIRSASALVLAFCLTVALFFPVLFANIKVKCTGNSFESHIVRPIHATHFTMYEMTEDQIIAYNMAFAGYENCRNEILMVMELMGTYKVSELRNGEADHYVNALAAAGVMTAFWRAEAATVFQIIYMLMLLIGMGALLVGANCIRYLLLGSYNIAFARIGKALCGLFAVLSLIAVIVFCITLRIAYTATDLDKNITFLMGVGTILQFVFAMVTLFVAPNRMLYDKSDKAERV